MKYSGGSSSWVVDSTVSVSGLYVFSILKISIIWYTIEANDPYWKGVKLYMPPGFRFHSSNSDALIVIGGITLALMLATDSLIKQRKYKKSLIVPCVCIVVIIVPLLLRQPLVPEFGILLFAAGNYIWRYREEKMKENSEKS
jgi:hypothetical protein